MVHGGRAGYMGMGCEEGKYLPYVIDLLRENMKICQGNLREFSGTKIVPECENPVSVPSRTVLWCRRGVVRAAISNNALELLFLALTHRYIHQWTESSLDQTVACLLFGIKPLSEPVQTCFNYTIGNMFKWNIIIIQIFSFEKMYLNMPSEMVAILSQQKCVLMNMFNIDWKVSIKASETYMVYFWVTLYLCIVVLILNFTGQLINEL